jgi:hypothetical protein
VLRREARLGFAHPLVRAAVFEDMTAVEREQAHAAAAVLLANAGAEAEEIAAHLLLTPHRADPDVVEALRGAARLAVGRGAPESAAAYLRRALEEPPLPAARAPILFELGLAERRLDAPTAGEHLRGACEVHHTARRWPGQPLHTSGSESVNGSILCEYELNLVIGPQRKHGLPAGQLEIPF